MGIGSTPIILSPARAHAHSDELTATLLDGFCDNRGLSAEQLSIENIVRAVDTRDIIWVNEFDHGPPGVVAML